jgi:glutamate racemase
MIQQVVGEQISLIDSGKETARKVKEMLINSKLERREKVKPSIQFYVSDIPYKFDEIGTRFLGRPVGETRRVEFDKFLVEQGKNVYDSI